VGENIWSPLDFPAPDWANERVGAIGHDSRALFQAKIVIAIADRAANIFVEHQHEIALRYDSRGIVTRHANN
jgi:hypothetical protein